jgi:hypothetical protein
LLVCILDDKFPICMRHNTFFMIAEMPSSTESPYSSDQSLMNILRGELRMIGNSVLGLWAIDLFLTIRDTNDLISAASI